MEYRAGPNLNVLYFVGGVCLVVAAALLVLPFASPIFAGAQFGVMGVGISLLGAFAIGTRMHLGRREARTMSGPPDAPAEAVAWTLSNRSGWWKDDVDGRTFVAHRLSRRGGIGHVIVRASAGVGSKAVLLKRSGVTGKIGSAVERAAGIEVLSGETLGYAAYEVSMVDPAWASPIFSDAEVRRAVELFEANDLGASVLAVELTPGSVAVRFAFPERAEVTPSEAACWMDGLRRVAAVAEAAPPPSEVLSQSTLGAIALDPARARRIGLKIVFLFGLAMTLVIAGAMLIVILTIR